MCECFLLNTWNKIVSTIIRSSPSMSLFVALLKLDSIHSVQRSRAISLHRQCGGRHSNKPSRARNNVHPSLAHTAKFAWRKTAEHAATESSILTNSRQYAYQVCTAARPPQGALLTTMQTVQHPQAPRSRLRRTRTCRKAQEASRRSRYGWWSAPPQDQHRQVPSRLLRKGWYEVL
jgi:hypothetical protein